MKLGFIGFGGAGSGLAKGLNEAGLKDIYYYDRMQQTPPYGEAIRRRAGEIGAKGVSSAAELITNTEVIISCVTGSVALAVAEEGAPFLRTGQLFADVNTTSPRVKERIAEIIEKTDALFVDAAIMGAVPAYLHRVPILAAGRGAERFKATMEPFGMNIDIIGLQAGQASAIKMFRSIFMKGLLSLLLETFIAAERYGVRDRVLDSLASSLDNVPFRETARLQVTKGVVNAKRMAEEMAEVIATLEELESPDHMSRASRATLNWCADLGLRERFGGEMPSSLIEVLSAIKGIK